MPNPNLSGKTALVTGGAQRVGRAVALALAQAGMDVAITCNTSAKQAAQVVTRIRKMGGHCEAIRVDFTRPDAAGRVHSEFIRRFDRLDVLVNNAAVFEKQPLGRVTEADWDRTMAVNARMPLKLIQKFAPMLREHARVSDPRTLGRVVNFIDAHAMGRPLRGYAAYNASKAALWEVTRSTALELAPEVTVNAVAPGVVAWAKGYSAAERRRYLKRVPLGRAGAPEDAATAVLYLVRDAHYCTGQVILLDGGRHLA